MSEINTENYNKVGEEENFNKTTKTDIYNIDPRAIVVVDGFNSRQDFGNIEELAKQIQEQGMLNPISVVPFKTEDGKEKYRLVDGERRYRAVMSLIDKGVDIARIKAIFLSRSLSDAELYVQQVMRNEGKPFNEYEMGVHCSKLKDICGKTNSEIAEMLGKNVGQISYYLGVLEMTPEAQEVIKTNRISASNIRRIYEACKHDEMQVSAEVMKLVKAADKQGKEKLSLKDLGEDSAVAILKDTKTIAKGIELLLSYYYKASDSNKNRFNMTMTGVLKELKNGKTIVETLDEMKTLHKQAQ
jgi:ParB family transcriptional regulator, chromosome partitioning protein